MRSCANGHSAGSGPASPCALTICGVSLNPVPPRWQDIILDFGP